MRARRAWFALAAPLLGAVAACAGVLGLDDVIYPPADDAGPMPGPVADAITPGVDGSPAGPPRICDAHAAFASVRQLQTLHSATTEEGRPTLEADELTIYFHRSTERGIEIARATRVSREAEFGAPLGVALIATWSSTYGVRPLDPTVTGDGRFLYLRGDTPAEGKTEIYLVIREPPADFIGLQHVVGMSGAFAPFVTADGGHLYYQFNDQIHLVTLARDTIRESRPVQGARGAFPVVSPDERVIYFTGGVAPQDISTADLDTSDSGLLGDASTLARFGDLNNPAADDMPGWISADGCRFYFSSSADSGKHAIFLATR